MRRLTSALTILLALFMIWIVYLADTGQRSVFFDGVKAVPLGDKIGHFFLFGSLALGANLALRWRGIRIGRWIVPVGAIVVFLLAAGEEFSQRFVSTRTCDITDLLADLAGIAVFSALGMYFVRMRRRCDNRKDL